MIYRLKLDQLSLNRPSVEEKEGISKHLWPYEARTRNLTYSSPLYVDVEQTTYTVDPETNIEVGLLNLLGPRLSSLRASQRSWHTGFLAVTCQDVTYARTFETQTL